MTHRPVDIHAHFYPEELITLWREEGPRCGGDVADVAGKGGTTRSVITRRRSIT